MSNNSRIDLVYKPHKRLTNLKELDVFLDLGIAKIGGSIEVLAKSLTNLERLTMNKLNTSRVDIIMPFIRYSKTLTALILFDLHKIFNATLNEERKKLANACQLSIFVIEPIYLLSKWKSKDFV